MPRIGSAPSGEDSSIDGTEKFPATGSKWVAISTIFSTYYNALAATLTNKTLIAPTIADFTNAAHDHGDADDGGAVVSASTTVAGVAELATNAETITGTDTTRAVTPAGLRAILETLPRGGMFNLKLSVTVSSNDLVVALKTYSGGDPSATDPGWIRIGDTTRSVTAATSMTLADATNWYGAGSSETAATEIDYFAYAVWDSNSSIVAVSAARIPYGNLVSDFSATTTSDRHLGNYANFTSTDEVEVIGRFAATLSAAAGHVWTVPTFTAINLIQRPIYNTRRLTWIPTLAGYSANPTSTVYQYVVENNWVKIYIREGANGTSNATSLTLSAPFTALTLSNGAWLGFAAGVDNTASLTTTARIAAATGSATLTANPNMDGGSAWTNSGGKRLAIGCIEFPIG